MKNAIYVIVFFIIACKKEKPYSDICVRQTQNDSNISIKMEELNNLIFDIPSAHIYQYQCKDDNNNLLDCIKIIAYQNDSFIGVYHSIINNQFCVNLALSTDLLNWKFKTTLATNAHQPCIYKTLNCKYIVAWEQEPNNHLKIVQYDSYYDLINNNFSNSKDIPQLLSKSAEGTPNIYFANDSIIELGFHYYYNGNVDRQAHGVLYNFSNWNYTSEHCIDNALLQYNIKGNIGDRDNFKYLNSNFLIIEAQKIKNNFGTWNCYIYNKNINKSVPIDFKSHNNSKSFANPTIYFTTIGNQNIILVTIFIPSENAGENEAGELIYYKYI